MGGFTDALFGRSEPDTSATDALIAEREAEAAAERKRIEAEREEEKQARLRRLRGSRSLFSGSARGYPDDERTPLGGSANV